MKWKPFITNVPGAPLTVLIAAFCEDNNSSSSLWAVGSICLINHFKSLAKIHLHYKQNETFFFTTSKTVWKISFQLDHQQLKYDFSTL